MFVWKKYEPNFDSKYLDVGYFVSSRSTLLPDFIYFNFWSTRKGDKANIAARCPLWFPLPAGTSLPEARAKRQNTRMHIYADSRREPNLTKSAGVGSEMQRDIMARQTNVDVRATSAERAVYFWQWAGNLAGSLQIRVQVGCVGAARWSQRGIAVTISDHANSGLVPFSDSCTPHGVPQHPYIARRRVESAAEHESALSYKKRGGGARIESVIPNEPCLRRSTFCRGGGKRNDKVMFR